MFMANTRSATLSIRLKSETKKRLARLAKVCPDGARISSSPMRSNPTSQIRNDCRQRSVESDRQVKSGHYVAHEDMKAWLLSWGTDRELPPPKCACGKHHDDEPLWQ